ncbi:hypothetical protein [Streptomyces sp. KN37]|uniref:hypothetical protein n=1 Tax=Streptomyces sp. KN37 TaxID=3090667 RepID=UPI002A750247|nr:hypothetical protein [Streptomyces sp. KN37]WPO70763.1 hypothetical protein R9806_09050 [Streptomyces sp. KN37]
MTLGMGVLGLPMRGAGAAQLPESPAAGPLAPGTAEALRRLLNGAVPSAGLRVGVPLAGAVGVAGCGAVFLGGGATLGVGAAVPLVGAAGCGAAFPVAGAGATFGFGAVVPLVGVADCGAAFPGAGAGTEAGVTLGVGVPGPPMRGAVPLSDLCTVMPLAGVAG